MKNIPARIYGIKLRMKKEANSSNNFYKGYILAITAAVLWGVSGTFGQYLFQYKQIRPDWLVTMRSLVSGVLLLFFAQQGKPENILNIWRDKRSAVQLLLFGILGMLAVQLTYFIAISYSNAATATILQYLGPVIIVVYLAIRSKQVPISKDIVAIILALLGTFFLVTHGSIHSLSISKQALFWGISSAFALAYYTVQPIELLHKWDAKIVIGWGMVIAGIALSLYHQPWKINGSWNLTTWLLVSFIIFLGSLVAFYFYLVSVKLIGPAKASLLACTEPLSAAFFSVIWLKVPFGFFDWTGSFLIVATVFLLTIKGSEKSTSQL